MNNTCKLNRQQLQSAKNERISLLVVIITLVMMAAEIIVGILTGSMALLSDGIHMGTHALALFITLAAYVFARKQSHNPAFSFGTGKVGVLGGYTNAILLIIAGIAMAYESVERLIDPVAIRFNEAIVVAVIGLAVNVTCALILGHGNEQHSHVHTHEHDHSPGTLPHDHSHEDHNLRAAYLHVITDAMTSVLAIFALLVAKTFGWVWADPLVGILGAIVVTKWAVGLIRQTGSILLDVGDFTKEIKTIRQRLEKDGSTVKDLHIWQISENERSLIVSLSTSTDKSAQDYHRVIAQVAVFDHVTIEVNRIQEPKVVTTSFAKEQYA